MGPQEEGRGEGGGGNRMGTENRKRELHKWPKANQLGNNYLMALHKILNNYHLIKEIQNNL